MNGHRQSIHQAHCVTLEELQEFETCQATKCGPKQSYQEVPKTFLTPVPEDFRSESKFEHKVGLLKWDSLFNEGEGVGMPDKSMFHCADDGVNPYFEEVVAYLGKAQQACRKPGCELLRQHMMRNAEGNISAIYRKMGPIGSGSRGLGSKKIINKKKKTCSVPNQL